MPPPARNGRELMKVAVIVPVLNERPTIESLVRQLFSQTRTPDEVVVADGGSTDGTREALAALRREFPGLVVVDGPGGISENRNAAIGAASSEVIACTDAGCVPDPEWLQALVEPIEQGARWVAGFYRPRGLTPTSTAAGVVMMEVLEEVRTDRFLPGGSSQAFTKEAWLRVGGFPEGRNAGEDTLFGEQMKAHGYNPVFAPTAVVTWMPPATLGEMMAKARRWGEADGTNQVRTGAYLKVIAAYWVLPVMAALAGWWRWWAGVGVLSVWLGLVGYRTRFKYRWVSGAGKWFLIPIAHVAQQTAQSAGWLNGFGIGNLVRKVGQRLARPVRRILPTSWVSVLDPIAARPVRHNVVMVVDESRKARRWIDDTPDTYRVTSRAPDPELPMVIGTITSRRGHEPIVAPVSVSFTEASELGAVLDPQATYHQLRQTGLPYALKHAPGGIPTRRDPVTARGALLVMAAVPLHDVGGGNRGSQLAQEFVRRGFHVSYVHRYEAAESVDLGLRFIHPLLEEWRAEDFDLDGYLARVGTDTRTALIEFPHADFLPLARQLDTAGFRIVYDLIDDWSDPALGGWWYDRQKDDALIGMADSLVASAPALAASLAARTGRSVVEVPNGVNEELFGGSLDLPTPPDLPRGTGPVIEYHGSLYGEWFDWQGVRAVAESLPQARIVLIGDRPRSLPLLPGNVTLLGLKPQAELLSYLAHTSVGFVPFVVSATTHAVSPLKVYEYLAAGVPVAAPPLEPLLGLDGVYLDADLPRAVARALEAPRPDRAAALAAHSWGERVGRILLGLGMDLPPPDRPVVIRTRPVRHYRPEERLIP